ncbi:MAG TPA: alpha/beta fold hydrolase [Solirubrobacteraceae bacterium]|nr:alpha/beta fold hydrolase [Solirubrobacteraceae bacterium]
MRARLGKIALTLLAASAWTFGTAISARAQIAFAPCGDTNNFACGHLTVALDPTGATPGTLTLAMRRHRAPVEGGSSAVIALAGGPGQAAIPLTEGFLELLGPVSATRDLIVFDQRGTGLSHALACRPPKRRAHLPATPGQTVVRCAQGLGPTRAFFTTPDSVADIEAIRRAGGYEKLVLFGTSYGTKVAEQYAQAYPSHVEALVLDSVVTPNGPDPLNRSTFSAVPRILHQLCGYRECVHITAHPVADLARVVARTRRGAIVGRVIDRHGRAHPEPITSDDLLAVLLEGDFNPLLRAEFVPAARAAADGDRAPLARLLARAEGAGEEGAGGGVDGPLYLATTCEDEAFPWSRADAPRKRLSQAAAQLDALPASTFEPFTRLNALHLSPIEACAFWPYAAGGPFLDEAALPNVPAVILSGEADLRTPTANAREVAGKIPDSNLLSVPFTGHSVLTSESTSCASDALQAMFAAHPIKPCGATSPPPVLKLPPLAPARLADVAPTSGYHGLPGRTLQAVRLTLADLSHQLLLTLIEALGSGGIFASPTLGGGGLREGWYELEGTTIALHRYSYVPGVSLSGAVSGAHVAVFVGGSAAAHGQLRSDAHGTLAGTLGSVKVRLPQRSASSQAAQVTGASGTGGSIVASAPRLPVPLRDALRALPDPSLARAGLDYMLSSHRLSQASAPR